MSATRRRVLLLAPMTVLFLIGFLAPLLFILRESVATTTGAGVALDNYRAVVTSGYFRGLIGRTLVLSLVVVIVDAVLGYVLAVGISRGPRWARPVLLAIAVLPLLVSVVVKTFGWEVLLGQSGPLVHYLGISVLFRPAGVVIGMAQTFLPFMVLSLVTALDNVDRQLEDAAASLGSGPVQRFRKVTLPLTVPGLLSGSVVVLVLSISALIIPQILGGGKVGTLVAAIYDQATAAQNLGLASAAGIVLLAITVILLGLYGLVMRRATRR